MDHQDLIQEITDIIHMQDHLIHHIMMIEDHLLHMVTDILVEHHLRTKEEAEEMIELK